MKNSIYIMLSAYACLTACSDLKQANEANFNVAIQQYLDKKYPRCYFQSSFPTDGKIGLVSSNKPLLEALVPTGLVSVSDEPYEVSKFGKKAMVVKPVFKVTAKGREFFKVKSQDNGVEFGDFCFGKATLNSIIMFSEPAESRGMKASEVKFSYTIEMPEWAKHANLTQRNYNLKKDIESTETPIEDSATVVLTNKGWVHAQMFN